MLHLALLGCGVAAATASLVWLSEHREKTAATEFGLFLVVLVLWGIVQIAEVLGGATTAYYASFLIRGLRGLMVFSWFYFTMTYAGYGDLVRSTPVRTVVVVGTVYLTLMTSVPPVATELIFPSITTVTDPFVAVNLGGTTPFRRTTQAVGYSLFVVGTVALTYRFVATGYTRRWRPVAFLGTALFIATIDLVLEKRAPFLPGIDYAAVGTPIAAVVLIAVLYRHDLFGSVPVGRDHLFRTLRDPVFVVDADHRIVDRNDAAASLCRSDRGIGDGLDPALPGDRTLERTLSADPEQRPTLRFDRGGDVRRYEPVTSDVSPVAGSRVTVLVLRDVTDLMRERRKLERQNDRMEAVAGVISHDLRTPLDVVDMRLDLAREDPSIEHLDAIARASARIDTLIDDLLTLTRHGTDVGTVEPVDLVSLTESCWRTVATGNATLRVDVGRTVDANPARLRRLLENLLRNAVEHGSTSPHSADRGDAVEHGSTSPRTSSGDAVKHGSASTRTASGDSVAHSATGGRPEADDAVGHGSDGVTVTVGELPDGFYVEDDGPGIPAGDRDRVFEAGYSTVAGGTGLGLSIVTQVADAHGWDVRVTDGVDGGARFEVTGVWPAE